MQPDIPEEYNTLAALLGESAAIDSLMINAPTTLATNTNTLKRGIAEYREQQKQERAYQQPSYPQVPLPPQVNLPQYFIPHQELPSQIVDDPQMGFNFEPTKVEEMILLLKEISQKLTKQNNLLETLHATQPKSKTVSEPIVKLVPDK